MINPYVMELVNFSMTLVVKNAQFAAISELSELRRLNVASIPEIEIPYYKKLAGELPPDKPIYIKSLDTGETIEFTKSTLSSHVKTGLVYKIPNQAYLDLLKNNPTQVSYIKHTVYPVDIQDAINAKSGELLRCDPSLLESMERANIVMNTRDYFKYSIHSGFVQSFCFEDLYPHVHWSITWKFLVPRLMMHRMININTANVHPKHIWEHLSNYGLDDYRSALNDRQQQYLYRNVDYIMAHKGTTMVMEELSDNLLREFGIDRGEKILLINTDGYEDTLQPTSEVVTKRQSEHLRDVITSDGVSIDEFYHKLASAKLIPVVPPDAKLEELDHELALAQSSWRPTNFMELQKTALNRPHANTFSKICMDNLLYYMGEGLIDYRMLVKVPGMEVDQPMTAKEGIALLHFCLLKTVGTDATLIPNRFYVQAAFQHPFTPRPSNDHNPPCNGNRGH